MLRTPMAPTQALAILGDTNSLVRRSPCAPASLKQITRPVEPEFCVSADLPFRFACSNFMLPRNFRKVFRGD
jgi:hypothetical protein